ncbi:MAG TPA: hypothetical protein VIV12_18280 [Streptosporangiaceae bacterium]
MSEGLAARRAPDHFVTALAESARPRHGSVVLQAYQRRGVEMPDVEAICRLAAENPARGNGVPRFLAECQQPHDQLQQDLRLSVSTHGAEHGIQLAGRIRDDQR